MKTSMLFRSLMAVLASAAAIHAQVEHDHTAWSAKSRENRRTERLKYAKPHFEAALQVPTNASCAILYGTPCYSPQDIRNAYGLTPLIDAGFTGSGQTIVIIVSFGSPTIEQDLKQFDAMFGLPDPPSFTVLAPLGTVPFDPTNTDQLIWASEASLDVEWAHAIAPGANIVLMTSPVDETQGVQGLPEFLELEKYAVEHHLGQIISQSWGTTENTLFDPAGQKVLLDFSRFYKESAEEGVTILAASGDSGTSNVDVNGNLYSSPTVVFPASSPYVTAVGGTTLNLDSNGQYQSETVWNNSYGASGGGVSQFFKEPRYQFLLPTSVRGTLNGGRGIPDVAFDADPNTPIWICFGFFPDATQNGCFPYGSGTSAATAQWAGVVALANQRAGRPLGFLNPKLYLIGATAHQFDFFHDITVGSNAFNGLPGYDATDGWDLASGWGTPNLAKSLWQLNHDE